MLDAFCPLISVVVPVFNTGHALARCLDSICGQTYPHLEIICVDDGSTDQSADILRRYAERDKRIKVITQPNLGQSAARNAALDVASGEWIAGVDSDDYIDADTYESCLPAMREGRAQIICFGTRIVGHDPLRESYLRLKYDGLQEVTCKLLTRTNVCFWNKLYNRAWLEIERVRFPVGLWFEDEAFFHLNAVRASFIHYFPEAKYNYVVNAGGSIMDKAESGHSLILDRLHVLEYILEKFRLSPLPSKFEAVKLHIAAAHYFSYLRMSRQRREFAWNAVWQMFRDLVERFGLLSVCVPEELEYARLRVAYFYYCPPGVAVHLDDLYSKVRRDEDFSKSLHSRVLQLMGQIHEQNSSISALKADSIKHHNTRKMLESQSEALTELRKSVSDLKADSIKHHNTRKMLESLSEALTELRKSVSDLKADLIKHHNTRKMLDPLTEALTELRKSVSELRADSAKHHNMRKMLESQSNALTEVRKSVSDLKADSIKHHNTRKMLQGIKDEVDEWHDNTASELKELRSSFTEVSISLKKSQEEVETMQQDFSALLSRRRLRIEYLLCCLSFLFSFGENKRRIKQRKRELRNKLLRCQVVYAKIYRESFK